MSIILPLEARPPPLNSSILTATWTPVLVSRPPRGRGPERASPHRSVIPLGYRAGAHGGRSHSARHTNRSNGHMRFLQNAELAALKRVQLFSTTTLRLSLTLSISPRLGNGSTLSPRASPATRGSLTDWDRLGGGDKWNAVPSIHPKSQPLHGTKVHCGACDRGCTKKQA